MQSESKEIKAVKSISRDEFNRQQDIDRERYREELSNRVGIKWCVALVAYGIFLYFFVTLVIPVGLLVFLTWNDHHF